MIVPRMKDADTATPSRVKGICTSGIPIESARGAWKSLVQYVTGTLKKYSA
jgi:hypothetical protein